jgi:phosphopantetheinyl transferase
MIRVRLGSVYHYGIFVSEDEVIAFGLPPVPEYQNHPHRFVVCAVDVDVFSCGVIPEVAEYDLRERRQKFSDRQIVANARARLGETGYNLLHNNCEHFANECVFGEKRSEQTESVRRRWLARPICDIYLTDIVQPCPGEPLYPPQRDAEIRACSHDGLRAARYAAWQLLLFAGRRSLALDPERLKFRKTHSGQWTCDKMFFSLSHTNDVAAVAVSNAPVGVDLEALSDMGRRFPDGGVQQLYDSWLTSGEKQLYPPTDVGFLTCWTRKEAVYKRTGRGSFHPLRVDTTKAEARTFRLPGGSERILSVSGEHAGSAHLFTTDLIKTTLLAPEEI